MAAHGAASLVLAVVAGAVLVSAAVASPPDGAPGCDPAPADSHWSADVRDLPVHDRSATYVDAIGADRHVHADFGSGLWDGGPIGIPYATVGSSQERVEVAFGYDDESDPGPYPIPPDAPIEGGADADGDRHVLVVDRDACVLYELFDAHPQPDGSWGAGSGAVFDLRDHTLRPDGWTSADAAGLPILPGLVRFEEVAAGRIDHAIRVTVPRSDASYLWPARHHAGSDDPDLPPMGLRLRLRSDADLSGLGPQARVVAEAMQRHGVIVADNGSPWFISGVPDERWDNDDLHTLHQLSGVDFQAIDASGLMLDPDSGAIASPDVAAARLAGGPGTGRIETAVAVSGHAFPDGAGVAVLARADGFADALAAGPLASALGAPLLLTPTEALAEATRTELQRLEVSAVRIAGGPAAIAPAVAEQLEEAGYDVVRHGGADRFETAAALSDAAVGSWRTEDDGSVGEQVMVALGAHPDPARAWPDALAAAAAGGVLHRPVLLTRADVLPQATLDALDRQGATGVTIVGGTGAIGAEVADQLESAGYSVDRVWGADRYATAVAVARLVLDADRGGSMVYVATGAAFPDALAAGPAASATDGHLVLTAPSAVPPPVADHVQLLAPIDLRAVGGSAALSDGAVAHLLDLAGS